MPELQLMPLKLDRRSAPEALEASDARQLQRVETKKQPGNTVRARGQTRATGVDAESTSVLNCGVFERADGVRQLVYGNANGDVKLALTVAPQNSDSDYGI
jgi:hypothetical protein